MPSLVAIVSAVSDELVARLAAASYPALIGGKILLGRQKVAEFSSPPRVIMTPMGSEWEARGSYTSQVMTNDVPPVYTDEAQAMRAQRDIIKEVMVFEVRCWGASQLTDPDQIRDDDFDMTRALYHATLQAMFAPKIVDGSRAVLGPMTKGGVELIGGKWSDAAYGSPQLVVEGREFVFGVRIPTPVLDRLLAFAPSDVAADPEIDYVDSDGTSEPAVTQT